MQFGICLSPAGPAGDPTTMAELAEEAEAAGWDGIFMEDYIVYQDRSGTPTFDPWVSMAAVAVRTRRLRIGTSVTAVPRRRPWKLASEAVTLDHLSGGRFVLGVGSGDVNEAGWRSTGEPLDAGTRAQMLDEALQILVQLWSGEPVTFKGRHYEVDSLRMAPRPVQEPRIPIWVGGDWLIPGVRARVSRFDGSCVYKGSPEAEWQDLSPADVAEIRAAGGGQDVFDVCTGGRQRSDDWDQDREHIAAISAAGATWWNEWIDPVDRERTIEAVRRGPLRLA